jgi:hypothetical protein
MHQPRAAAHGTLVIGFVIAPVFFFWQACVCVGRECEKGRAREKGEGERERERGCVCVRVRGREGG